MSAKRGSQSTSRGLSVVLDWVVCLAWLLFGVLFIASSISGNERHVVLFLAHTFAPYLALGSMVAAIPLCVAVWRRRPFAKPMMCGCLVVCIGAVISTVIGYQRVGFSAPSVSDDSGRFSFTVLDATFSASKMFKRGSSMRLSA
jgi:hypothetical protein